MASTALLNHMPLNKPDTFPRWVLWATACLLTFTIGGVALVRITGLMETAIRLRLAFLAPDVVEDV